MVTSIINLALPVDDPNRVIEINGYQAESYSESPSTPNYDSVDIQGRSSPLVFYQSGGSRQISFSMLLHRDMIGPYSTAVNYASQPGIGGDPLYTGVFLGSGSRVDHGDIGNYTYQDLRKDWEQKMYQYYQAEIEDAIARATTGLTPHSPNYFEATSRVLGSLARDRIWEDHNIKAEIEATARFHLLLNKIRALNYPVYTPQGIIPPKCYLKIGGNDNGWGGLRLKGYCSTQINHDGIVKFNSLISTSIDFTFTEVVDIAWSAPEVIDNMQRYIQWMDVGLR